MLHKSKENSMITHNFFYLDKKRFEVLVAVGFSDVAASLTANICVICINSPPGNDIERKSLDIFGFISISEKNRLTCYTRPITFPVKLASVSVMDLKQFKEYHLLVGCFSINGVRTNNMEISRKISV
jgi:hypothetical protein